MKYYKVANDIIKTDAEGNPTWTDEPLWLRNEIDQWKERYGQNIGGGRFFATSDARYSYIISPNENLMALSNNDLIELSEEEISNIIAVAFPPQVIERDGEPNEIIPTPSLSKVCSIYWGYATNHTGTISSNESWTVANNDHHITGNITINADVVVTWDAGINVYYDGNYSITRTAGSSGTTTLTAIGTAQARITIEANQSRTGTGSYNTITTGITGANSTALTLQYCNIANFSTFIVTTGYTNYSLTFSHNYVRSCNVIVQNTNTITVPAITISNCLFSFILSQIISLPTNSTATTTHTISDCLFIGCGGITSGTVSSGTMTINHTDNRYIGTIISNASGSVIPAGQTHNFTRCIIEEAQLAYAAAVASATDCIFFRIPASAGIIVASTSATTNCSITTSDIIGARNGAWYAAQNNSTAATTLTLTSCFMSGTRGADIYCYYTGTETPAQTAVSNSGIITFTTGRTTRNFSFTPASISSSSIGVNTATISWSCGFKTRNRVIFGTVSGTYTMAVEPSGSWSNYEGNTMFTANPSIALSNLKMGTTYYYKCQSFDWVTNDWVTSSENTFTTTGSNFSRAYFG